MGNTNFQTIHQMGTAISNMVKQATGRDDVQNIDMEHITVAQNHRYEEIDLSGQVVSFRAGEAGLPFEKMVVQIKTVQSGSGDPSPDNIRPFIGWTAVNVYQAGQNMEDARVFRFTTPSEAGIVYGGTLDVISGDLMVNIAYALLNNPDRWVQTNGTTDFKYETAYNDRKKYDNSYDGLSCSYMIVDSRFQNIQTARWIGAADTIFGLRWISGNLEQLKADAAEGKIAICYELATPLTYHLTPQEITTLLGQNYIWADTGDIEVKFTNVKEMY